MDVTTWQRAPMETFVNTLRKDFPALQFVAGSKASWSPLARLITYKAMANSDSALWTLLHELGHALLEHTSYESDASLLQKEAAAWKKAQQIAKKYNIAISEDHIQDCLDTYRDWLHKRSNCPVCSHHGIQPSQSRYSCPNCQNTWKVSSARFCRPYRLKNIQTT
jgi:hypothetical protein